MLPVMIDERIVDKDTATKIHWEIGRKGRGDRENATATQRVINSSVK